MNAPPFDNFGHFKGDLLSERLPILKNVVHVRVGDLVSHNGGGHRTQRVIGKGHSFSEVQIFERLERTFAFAVHSPLNHRVNFDTLHLLRHLLCIHFNLVQS